MIIGCPKEIKPSESRVALTPAGARALPHPPRALNFATHVERFRPNLA